MFSSYSTSFYFVFICSLFFFLILYLLLICFHISSRSSVLSRFRILSSSTFLYIVLFISAGMSFNHLLLLFLSLLILLSAFISSYIYFLPFLCLVFSKINSFPLLIERIFHILPYSPFSLLLFFSHCDSFINLPFFALHLHPPFLPLLPSRLLHSFTTFPFPHSLACLSLP